jgi:hypothetical protein
VSVSGPGLWLSGDELVRTGREGGVDNFVTLCSDNALEKISKVDFNSAKLTHRHEKDNCLRCVSFLVLPLPSSKD